MEFSKRGALVGFISGAVGGILISFTDYSFPLEILLAISAAVVVALIVNFTWNLMS